MYYYVLDSTLLSILIFYYLFFCIFLLNSVGFTQAVPVSVFASAHVHVHAHTLTHAHTHAHTHTLTLEFPFPLTRMPVSSSLESQKNRKSLPRRRAGPSQSSTDRSFRMIRISSTQGARKNHPPGHCLEELISVHRVHRLLFLIRRRSESPCFCFHACPSRAPESYEAGHRLLRPHPSVPGLCF